jgi:hypothetical protein
MYENEAILLAYFSLFSFNLRIVLQAMDQERSEYGGLGIRKQSISDITAIAQAERPA